MCIYTHIWLVHACLCLHKCIYGWCTLACVCTSVWGLARLMATTTPEPTDIARGYGRDAEHQPFSSRLSRAFCSGNTAAAAAAATWHQARATEASEGSKGVRAGVRT